MEVRPGDFVNIQTAEVVTLSDTDLGMVFAKVSLTQRGFTSFGSKIDPGYSGRLLLSFTNNGHSIQQIRPGQAICMISIVVMDQDAGKGYQPSPTSPPPSRPVVTLSLEATADERKLYERSFSRAQLNLFDLLPRLHAKVRGLEETVNVTRRQALVGFLTSTVPTMVLGGLVITLAVVTITGGTDSAFNKAAETVPALPLGLSMLALVLGVVAIILSLVRKP